MGVRGEVLRFFSGVGGKGGVLGVGVGVGGEEFEVRVWDLRLKGWSKGRVKGVGVRVWGEGVGVRG